MKLFDLDKLLNTLTGYIETKIELVKLDAKDELAHLIAKLLVFVALAISGLLAISFLSFGLAVVFNGLFDSRYLGFILVGVIYFILSLIVFIRKEEMIRKLNTQGKEQEDETIDSDNENV